MENKAHTEEFYVASIDLLGVKGIIKSDVDDKNLNQIKNIYSSWKEMLEKDGYFQEMKIRFFSDNCVIALQASKLEAADKIFETTARICRFFLKRGYKPRGGITKGQFYIDEIFVWGPALVDAYLIESKQAIYPRIVIDEKIINEAREHLRNQLIYKDEDEKMCLNYLKSFGGNREAWIKDIEEMLRSVNQEIRKLQEDKKNKKIMDKLIWLKEFEEKNLQFWMKKNENVDNTPVVEETNLKA